jgi:cell division protein FtsA
MKIAFENINQHLKSIGRDGLLPAGVVMTGGGAALSGIKTFAENSLKLPSQIGEINFSSKEGGRISSNVWSVACGLSIVGFNTDEEQHMIGSKNGGISAENGKRWFKKILKAITQFLP